MNSYSNTKRNTYFVEISLEQIIKIRNTIFWKKWHSIRRHKIHQKLPLLFLVGGWNPTKGGFAILRARSCEFYGSRQQEPWRIWWNNYAPWPFIGNGENTTTEKMGKYRNIWHMWGIGKQRWWKIWKDMITSLSYLYYLWLHGLFNLFLVEAYVSLIGKGSSKKQHPTILFNCNVLQQAWAQNKVHPTKTD